MRGISKSNSCAGLCYNTAARRDFIFHKFLILLKLTDNKFNIFLMASKVFSAVVVGLDCELVEVEADNSPHGQPGIYIVGLPDKAVDESKSRVRSAVKNSDLEFPRGNVTINLAPADIRKAGTYYDLPIALACLIQSKQIDITSIVSDCVFVGELSLEGKLRPVNGVLSVKIMYLALTIRRN